MERMVDRILGIYSYLCVGRTIDDDIDNGRCDYKIFICKRNNRLEC